MSKYSASKYEWKIPSVHIFVGDGFFLSRDSSSSVRMLMPTLDREKNHTQCLFLLARAFFSTLVLRHIYVVQRAQWFSRAWNIKKCWIRFVFCLCIAPVRVYIANFMCNVKTWAPKSEKAGVNFIDILREYENEKEERKRKKAHRLKLCKLQEMLCIFQEQANGSWNKYGSTTCEK